MTPLTENEAKCALIGPVAKGSNVVVVRGRKVPHGTCGVVRWEGDGEWGPRIGMSVKGEEKLVYIALKNVEAMYPGLLPGQHPREGWASFYERVMRERTLPKQGHHVRHKETGQEGVVFWVEDGRAGFKETAQGDQAVWANADELLRLGEHGVPLEYNPVVPACPFSEALIAITEQREPLPFPFCNIRSLDPAPDGQYRALDARGHYIALLPADAAKRLMDS
jgi:hypothetical protein